MPRDHRITGGDEAAVSATSNKGTSKRNPAARVDIIGGAGIQVGSGNIQYNNSVHIGTYIQGNDHFRLTTRKIPADNTLPLPAHFEPRPELFEAARDALLSRGDGTARRVGLAGMGGAGKSVLARALALDPRVRRAFRGGIRWVYLGQDADPGARLIELAGAFGDNRPAADSQHRLAQLNEWLADASCLVILDDVWDAAHLREFELSATKSALLITTRFKNILDSSVAKYEVGTLPEEPARQLLAAWAEQDLSSLPAEAHDVERQCDGLPLALAIAGGMAKGGYPWKDLRDCLLDADLQYLEFVLPNYREYENLYRVLDASVRRLPDDKQERYLELAVFEGRGQVPNEVAARLWREAGISEPGSTKLVFQLGDRSLLQRTEPGRFFTLHSLQFGYVRGRLGPDGARALHGRLADTFLSDWGKLTEGLCGLPASDLEEPAERYGVVNLAGHLSAAGRDSALHQLLALHQPGQSGNLWYAAHDRIGETIAYSADVQLAWNAARAAADCALAAAEPAPSIGLEVRYALLSATISSITASLPAGLIAELVADGQWTADEGLKRARLLASAEARAAALVGLLAVPGGTAGPPSHAAEIAREAAAEARAIEDSVSRASALTALAAHAPEPGRKEAVAKAWETVAGLRWEPARALALVNLANAVRLPGPLLTAAHELARESRDPGARVLMLSALVPQLRAPERDRALATAGDAAATLPAGFAQASALASLAAQAPKPERGAALDRARTAAGALSQPEERAAVLTVLLPVMPAQAAAEKEVLAEIDMIGSPDAAVAALIALIPKARAGRRPDLIWQAAGLAAPIQRAEDKADALIALAGLLAACDGPVEPSESQEGAREGARELRERAVSAIREISEPAARSAAYTALARHQRAGFRSAMLALALTEARAIGDAGQLAGGVAALVARLPWTGAADAGLDGRRAAERAINNARASGQRALKVISLAALALALPEDDRVKILKEASADAYQLRDPAARAQALTALLPALTEPSRPEAIEQALVAVGAMPDPDLRLAALTALVTAAPAALRQQAERVAQVAGTVRRHLDELASALAACGLAPEDRQEITPAILADPALAADPLGGLPPTTPAAERAAVRRAAAGVSAAIGALRASATALAAMAASAGPGPGSAACPGTALAIGRARSAAGPLETLTEPPGLPERLGAELSEALKAIEEARSRAPGDGPPPGPPRDENPRPPWEPHWRAIMDGAAARGRAALACEVSGMGAAISDSGGDPAVEEALKALFDVGRWWP
jgi:NB-ARC domain